MKMKKVAIASITIGTMLTMAACSPSADKETEKKEQVTAQNDGEAKRQVQMKRQKQRKILKKKQILLQMKTDKDAKIRKNHQGQKVTAKRQLKTKM